MNDSRLTEEEAYEAAYMMTNYTWAGEGEIARELASKKKYRSESVDRVFNGVMEKLLASHMKFLHKRFMDNSVKDIDERGLFRQSQEDITPETLEEPCKAIQGAPFDWKSVKIISTPIPKPFTWDGIYDAVKGKK